MNEREFKQYRRKQIAELADWEPGFDMSGVWVSEPDRAAGSPKPGDKIARNPVNHADRWLVAADYFAANFEAPSSPAPAKQEQAEARELVKPAFVAGLLSAPTFEMNICAGVMTREEAIGLIKQAAALLTRLSEVQGEQADRKTFKQWWHERGSRMLPDASRREIAIMAWSAAMEATALSAQSGKEGK